MPVISNRGALPAGPWWHASRRERHKRPAKRKASAAAEDSPRSPASILIYIGLDVSLSFVKKQLCGGALRTGELRKMDREDAAECIFAAILALFFAVGLVLAFGARHLGGI